MCIYEIPTRNTFCCLHKYLLLNRYLATRDTHSALIRSLVFGSPGRKNKVVHAASAIIYVRGLIYLCTHHIFLQEATYVVYSLCLSAAHVGIQNHATKNYSHTTYSNCLFVCICIFMYLYYTYFTPVIALKICFRRFSSHLLHFRFSVQLSLCFCQQPTHLGALPTFKSFA